MFETIGKVALVITVIWLVIKTSGLEGRVRKMEYTLYPALRNRKK
jgi:hypothetical protein